MEQMLEFCCKKNTNSGYVPDPDVLSLKKNQNIAAIAVEAIVNP